MPGLRREVVKLPWQGNFSHHASSLSCRAAVLKLKYKFIPPCPKGGHNLENIAKHFPIPFYLTVKTEVSVLAIKLSYLVFVLYLITI